MSILSMLGRAIGDGFTLAAEILCPRDHTAEDRLRSWELAAEAVEDEICDEADATEDADLSAECLCWVGHGNCGGCSGVLGISHEPACGWEWNPYCPQHADDSSAAVSAAADPSPAVLHPTVPRGAPGNRRAGGEGSGEVSDILPSASPERPNRRFIWPTSVVGCGRCDAEPWVFEVGSGVKYIVCGAHGQLGRFDTVNASSVPESDPGEVSHPSPGEHAQIGHEDLAAHIEAVRNRYNARIRDGKPCAAFADEIASDLLADYRITDK